MKLHHLRDVVAIAERGGAGCGPRPGTCNWRSRR